MGAGESALREKLGETVCEGLGECCGVQVGGCYRGGGEFAGKEGGEEFFGWEGCDFDDLGVEEGGWDRENI